MAFLKPETQVSSGTNLSATKQERIIASTYQKDPRLFPPGSAVFPCVLSPETRKTVELSRNGTVWCCRLQLVFGAANSSAFELIQDIVH